MTSLPFGKYRGKRLADVPRDYLGWLAMQPWVRPDTARAVAAELDRRAAGDTTDCRRLVPMPAVADAGRAIIAAGYRAVSKRAHPDAGGTHALQLTVNAARDYLDAALVRGVA